VKLDDYRGMFRFRIGTTSYIFPFERDNLAENVRALKDKFDIIQLLCYDSDYVPEFLSPGTIAQLRDMAIGSGIEYTVHLPIDLDLLAGGKTAKKSMDLMEKIIAETNPIGVTGYVLHVSAPRTADSSDMRNHETTKIFGKVLDGLSGRLGQNAKKVLLENLDYDLCGFSGIIFDYPFNICMDIGHLYRFKYDFDKFINTFEGRIKLLHLHGFDDSGDHGSIARIDGTIFNIITGYLEKQEMPVIIEVFNHDDLAGSMELLKNTAILKYKSPGAIK
jgi:sugar phosphate isomerase/epimerase